MYNNYCCWETVIITEIARVAQLVEHNLAKVGAAGSSPVSRLEKNHLKCGSFFFCLAQRRQLEPQEKYRNLDNNFLLLYNERSDILYVLGKK